MSGAPLVTAQGLSKHYILPRSNLFARGDEIRAVDRVFV